VPDKDLGAIPASDRGPWSEWDPIHRLGELVYFGPLARFGLPGPMREQLRAKVDRAYERA